MSGGNSSRNDGIAIEEAGRTEIEVKETGEYIIAEDTVYGFTNHYIKESRRFFPNTTLCTYTFTCPRLLKLARSLWIASLLGFLVIVINVPKELSLVLFLTCAVFFLIYCQHEWVNQKSLPVVKKQPVFDGQRHPNSFYEVTVTELNGVALENYQAGIAFVQLTQGKIEFQAFNKTAIKFMSRAKCLSRVMLVLFFLTSVYNLFFVIVAYTRFLKGGS